MEEALRPLGTIHGAACGELLFSFNKPAQSRLVTLFPSQTRRFSRFLLYFPHSLFFFASFDLRGQRFCLCATSGHFFRLLFFLSAPEKPHTHAHTNANTHARATEGTTPRVETPTRTHTRTHGTQRRKKTLIPNTRPPTTSGTR